MRNPDLDLATRHRYGDSRAFEEVYERYGGMIFNLALRMTGDVEEAADLCQETFLKIHRHLGGFRGRSALRTWVYCVAVNCCRSRFRRQKNRRQHMMEPSPEGLEDLPDPRRGPEERTISRDTRDRVAAALEQLPPIYREVVLLRDLEGLTYREISRVLGVRLGTVRSRLARGRDRLRELLENGP